ncbi:hypothetical protein SEA_BIG4_319 [Microbacterium phage Big4]|nr:hypothetical protein SEA_BIG4_319 [Microbacterium phage Big4]
MTDQMKRWVAEATEAANAKKNGAMQGNRRVKSTRPTPSGEDAVLDVYVRGTLVTLGSLKVTL